MDYKSLLRMKYVARSDDKEKQEFEVGNIAFINFGCKEIANQE